YKHCVSARAWSGGFLMIAACVAMLPALHATDSAGVMLAANFIPLSQAPATTPPKTAWHRTTDHEGHVFRITPLLLSSGRGDARCRRLSDRRPARAAP